MLVGRGLNVKPTLPPKHSHHRPVTVGSVHYTVLLSQVNCSPWNSKRQRLTQLLRWTMSYVRSQTAISVEPATSSTIFIRRLID